MNQNQINMWLGINAENFNSSDLPAIKSILEQMDDNHLMFLQNIKFQKPSTIFLIALLSGWERFLLGDIGLGIVKVITAYGCGVWWLIDVVSAKKRAAHYNFQQLQKATSAFCGGASGMEFCSTPVDSGSTHTENTTSAEGTAPIYDYSSQPLNTMGTQQSTFGRIKQLFANPHAEYQIIEKENLPHAKVLTSHVLPLLIIPFVFSFIGGTVSFGHFGYGFLSAFCQLLILFGGIYITTAIVNAMASSFGGKSDFNRAFSLVAYAYTPMLLAGIFQVWDGFLWIGFSVGIYGLYLLTAGLQSVMQPANEKINAYAARTFIVALLVYAILWKFFTYTMLPAVNLQHYY